MDTTLKAVISLDDQISGALGKIQGNLGKFQQSATNSASKIDKAFGGTFDRFNDLVKTTAIGAVGMGTAIAGFGIKTATELQAMAVNFQTLTGSAEKGQKVFSDLKKMGATTPFETQDLAKATQTMLSFGISVENSQKYLGMLGDVSMGNKEKLAGLGLAFSQVQSTGRLMGQDLLQMINQGFNPLLVLAQKNIGAKMGLDFQKTQEALKNNKITTGQVNDEMVRLKKAMEDGKVSASDVSEAFKLATSEGGLFYKGMERGSQTLAGRFSTLMDNAKNLSAGFVGLAEDGTVVEGSLLDLVQKGLNKVIEAMEKVDVAQLSKDVAKGIESIIKAVKDGIEFYKKYEMAINSVAIFLATLVVGLYAFHTAMQLIAGAKAIWIALSTGIGPVVLAIAALVAIGYVVYKNWDKITKFLGDLFNTIKESFISAWTSISNFFTSIWESIKSAIQTGWNFILNVIRTAIQSIIWAFQNWQTVLGFIVGSIIAVIVYAFMGLIALLKLIFVDGTMFIVNTLMSIPSRIGQLWGFLSQSFVNGLNWLKQIAWDGINAIISFFISLPGRAVGIWNSLRGMFSSGMDSLKNFVSSGLNGIVSFFSGLPGRIANAFGSLWNIGKDAAKSMWNGLISGLGKFGDGVKAALRLAGIRLASGTNFAFGGQYLVGETGPELVTLPRGAQVTRASETNDMMKGQTINISINNPSVRNDGDIEMIVEQVTRALNSTQRLKRLGV